MFEQLLSVLDLHHFALHVACCMKQILLLEPIVYNADDYNDVAFVYDVLLCMCA